MAPVAPQGTLGRYLRDIFPRSVLNKMKNAGHGFSPATPAVLSVNGMRAALNYQEG